jgi:hypothetical protein
MKFSLIKYVSVQIILLHTVVTGVVWEETFLLQMEKN